MPAGVAAVFERFHLQKRALLSNAAVTKKRAREKEANEAVSQPVAAFCRALFFYYRIFGSWQT